MARAGNELEGRVALVTGAGRGIGRAIALRFAHAGARVVVVARNRAELQATADLVAVHGGETLVIPTDITQDDQLDSLVRRTRAAFGGPDILVNNAGGGPPRASLIKTRDTDLDRTLQVNLRATVFLTKRVLPSMIEKKHGAIITIGSLAGFAGHAGEAAYAAAKFGLRGFMQAVFEEVRAAGIKVSLICPGYVDTALIPPNKRLDRERMLRPEDVANAAYGVAVSPAHCCPTELLLQPQYRPFT